MALIYLAMVSFLIWLYLALAHHEFWNPLFEAPSSAPSAWPSVDIIVPARNEAATLSHTLPALLAQDYQGPFRVLLVNDHSQDATKEIAQHLANATPQKLIVLDAPPLAQDWCGKVAAMNYGAQHTQADYILFTDADIHHDPTVVSTLVARALDQKLDLVSRMVMLHCENFAEKLLIPAFVFFFALLYPFREVNDPNKSLAAAAGGVMLLKRETLNRAGGLEKIRSAIIDDCALARTIKKVGKIELCLTRHSRSTRLYATLHDISAMIARTAFTQLRHSLLFLLATVLGMLLLFFVPVAALLSGSLMGQSFGLSTCLLMFILYWPIIETYRLPKTMVMTLPAAAMIYIGATIDSARLYWQGKGGQWKGRSQT